ncbi:unnamed protein product, partial [Adineta steineri]
DIANMSPILAPAQIPKPSLKVTEPTIQLPPPPPPPPVARRLSTNSIDVFADELYEQMIDPFIRETTYTIFDELISQWNNLTSQTVTIFNEFVLDEINSVANEYYNDFEFQQKMLRDTLNEENERKRKKYLTKKYFSIWFENSFQAQEERFIL